MKKQITLIIIFIAQLNFGQNFLISNGNNPDFEETGGFQSNLVLIQTLKDFTNPGSYAIVSDPTEVSPLFKSTKDRSGSGKMMIVDGKDNDVFWKQSPNIKLQGGVTYQFSYYIKNINKTNENLPTIVFQPQDQCNCPPILVAGNATVLPDGWNQVVYEFTPSGTGDKWVRLELSTLNASPSGHDFAIDDLSLNQAHICTPNIINVKVGRDMALCGENSTTISVETNGTGKWVKKSTGSGEITNLNSKTTTVTNLSYLMNNVFEWQADVNDCENLNIIDSSITIVALKNPDILIKINKLSCTTSEIYADINNLNYIYYNWTTTDGNIVSGQGTKSIVVDKNGTYQLEAVNKSTGAITIDCPVTQSIQITNINPIKAVIATPQSLTCSIASVVLDGSQSSNGANIIYEWTTKDGIISSGKNSAIATTYLPGTYNLTVTDITTNCSANSSVIVAQTASVPVIYITKTNDLSCTVKQVTIETNHVGENIEYNWITYDGEIISGQGTNKIEVTKAGIYYLNATNIENACSNSIAIRVLDFSSSPVLNLPILLSVCSTGDSKDVFYLEMMDEQISGGDPNITITYHKTLSDAENGSNPLNKEYYSTTNNIETLYYRGTDINGCYSTGILDLRVEPLPNTDGIKSTLTVCENNSDGFGEFYLPDSIIKDDLNYGISFHETSADAESGIKPMFGYYVNRNSFEQILYVRIQNVITACSRISTLKLEVKNCDLSSPEFEFSSQFDLLPNPAKEVISVSSKNNQKIQSVQIYNLMGQLVLETTSVDTEINISNLAKGTYLLKLSTLSGSSITKLVKE
mgnify:CR=1 FL=1